MNVLQLICPTGYYGAERWIVALANNLNDENLTCKLLIISEDKNSKFELENRYPSRDGNVLKLIMKSRFDTNAIKQLVQVIDEHEIDIVHTHGYKADVIALLAKFRRKSVRILSTPHGFGVVTDLKLKVFHKIGLWSLRYFDAVAPLSPALYKTVKQSGVSSSKLLLIPNGVDLTEMAEYEIVERNSSKNKRIGYIGRLAQGKQVEVIFRVFNSLWLQDNSLSLHIAGTGDELAFLKDIASKLPSQQAIHFLGFVEQRFELMQTLDLFVMTSVSEGTPRSLMEALFLKVPVVAYDVEGVDQLITNEETGLLAPLNNEDMLEQQCRRILTDSDLVDKVSSNGRARIVNEFSASVMAKRYRSLYSKMLAY